MDILPSNNSFSDYPGSKVAGKVKLSDHLAPCKDKVKKVFFLIPAPASVFNRNASIQNVQIYNTDRNRCYSGWDLRDFLQSPGKIAG